MHTSSCQSLQRVHLLRLLDHDTLLARLDDVLGWLEHPCTTWLDRDVGYVDPPLKERPDSDFQGALEEMLCAVSTSELDSKAGGLVEKWDDHGDHEAMQKLSWLPVKALEPHVERIVRKLWEGGGGGGGGGRSG